MKRKIVKQILALGMASAMSLLLLTGCGDGGSGTSTKDGKSNSDETNFTMWINMTDGGEAYDDYVDNPAVQFINAQYWDTKNGGIGTAENGTKLNFSFINPIAGSESENFNTMIATGEYPEIINLSVSSDTPQALYEAGITMDITEYVEKYMPNYLAVIEKNPEIKPLVTYKGEDGTTHYYALYGITEGAEEPWQGTCYRRDWVVKYAEPTEYVWDWESDYVKENGHPAVTPLEKAISEKNMEGWKKNDVTSFKAEYGDNPNETYSDNVIFPSGTSNPLTISDWEWMLAAFDRAITERGWGEDSSAYGYSLYYPGYLQTGDLVSSFGGGNGYYYIKDKKVSYDGYSENFKTYLECMAAWYQEGWLDTEFNTRAADMFFMINTPGVNQGKVGMWCGMVSTLGTAIRTTCQDPSDAADAYVMGCALPINDMYGSEDQMYQSPDTFYASSKVGPGPIALTNKAEGKDLVALFTFFDWQYTREGALVMRLGLSESQYQSVDLKPDVYKEYGFHAAYTEEKDEEGKTVYARTVDPSDTIGGCLCAQRMAIGINPIFGEDYTVDKGNPSVNQLAINEWTKYEEIGTVTDYIRLMSTEETEAFNKTATAANDYMQQNVPKVIKGSMKWEDYVAGLKALNPDSVVPSLQKIFE